MRYLFYNSVALSCVIGATLLALYGVTGWCWFLLMALLTLVIPTSCSCEEIKDGDGNDWGYARGY